MAMGVCLRRGIAQQTPIHSFWKNGSNGLFLRRPRRAGILSRQTKTRLVTANLSLDAFLPALGMNSEIAVLMSALLATTSVAINFFSGMSLESKKAELAIELEREKQFQQQ
eukprot:CAMPEP_0118798134 /NCGR_PEP_ID=MMETSP1161-20130426/564_1 /TAXON_ID=249345 /ORGANISM="Picochlorum oklahomensis, Strain CCMP2329" /LENGTH=110 /DNA_ID=CAMNT_0006725449 /DNA_START=177 /DNA_END=506 /DNA_ORIENTATION=+